MHEQGVKEPVFAAAVPSQRQPTVGKAVDHTFQRAAQEAEEKFAQYISNWCGCVMKGNHPTCLLFYSVVNLFVQYFLVNVNKHSEKSPTSVL